MVVSPSTPTCSVVIGTRDRPDALARCLEALARVEYPCFEVVVVDNASRDERARDVAGRWGARYLVEPAPGLSRARNRGARACGSDVIAFTDDDAVPDRLWLQHLLAGFQDAGVTVVTGRTVPASSDTFTPMAALPAEWTDLGPYPRRLDGSHLEWFEIASFGGIGIGNNMAFRRSVFDHWRGFDERLGRGAIVSSCEEHRAFAEIIERGGAVLYAPDAIVRHDMPETEDERRRQYVHFRADLVGYSVLLLATTSYRGRLARYIVEAVLGRHRRWRYRQVLPPAGGALPSGLLWAGAVGVWRGLRACARRSVTPASGVRK